MKKLVYYSLLIFAFYGCISKTESITPKEESITESVYASGFIESEDQYQVFPSVTGIVQEIFVSEGDFINTYSPLFSIYNESSRINRENASLMAQYSDVDANNSKLNDLKLVIELAKNKMHNDSLMYFRQKALFSLDIISASQLEQFELAYSNSKTSYLSSQLKLVDLKKQLNLNDKQSKNNERLSERLVDEFTVKSGIKGRVYSILKRKGEMVSVQTPIAIIGNANTFKIVMQVDEYDIIKIKKGLKIIVSLDSYKGKTFEAIISKIDPIMNDRSKTFVVEGIFTKQPTVLYPNLSLEANIIIQKKEKVLTIPRNYFINDQYVVLKNGDKKYVKVGLKDYEKVEVINGLRSTDEIIIPAP